MSGYERAINWNTSGKTVTEVRQAERIATLEQQNAELAAALGMLIDLHDAAGMPAGPIRNNAQKTIAKVKQP